MGKFSAMNRLCKCGCCGKLTHSTSSDRCIGLELCRVCNESAGQENSHNDGTPHGKADKKTCPVCAGVSCLHELKAA